LNVRTAGITIRRYVHMKLWGRKLNRAGRASLLVCASWTLLTDVGSSTERWDFWDNPVSVDTSVELSVAALPTQGSAARPPWPGDVWATSRDSINHRWDGGAPSPAEKVEQAFGLSGFSSAITNGPGVYGHARPECDQSSECAVLQDRSSCATPRSANGPKPGRCIPSWWSLDYGWAAAAISEPAPIRPVTQSGVTFYPGDIEGIASLAYSANLPVRMLGQRCNKPDPPLDTTGRMADGECRDLNAGSFHVVLANRLGLSAKSFVEDRSAESEVTNRPVRAYRVTNAVNGRLREVTKAEAMALLGWPGTSPLTLLPSSTLATDGERTGVHQVGASGDLTFQLQGTGDSDLYIRKNSAPTLTLYDCRPYSANSDETCTIPVTAGEQVFWMVRGYGPSSNVTLGVLTLSTSYVFNTSAKMFFDVELELDFVAEAAASRQSRTTSVDAYTQTDHYRYILETDASGRVTGGEWIGTSRTTHPDFLWWPTGTPAGPAPGGLTYARVRSLLRLAALRRR
jgi:transglutaminase elicitor/pre-peptidase